MDGPQLMLSLVQAKDPAALSEESATIIDLAKKSSTGESSSSML